MNQKEILLMYEIQKSDLMLKNVGGTTKLNIN